MKRPEHFATWAHPGTVPRIGKLLLAIPALLSTGVLLSRGAVFYVDLSSTNPVPPYTNWATAATNIQDAVDAVTVPGALVLVNDGVYQTGSRMLSDGSSNRVAVTAPLTLRAVNGPGLTFVDGGNAVCCAHLTNGAVLSGFTLRNGSSYSAGGVAGAGPEESLGTNSAVTNCVLIGNSGGGRALLPPERLHPGHEQRL